MNTIPEIAAGGAVIAAVLISLALLVERRCVRNYMVLTFSVLAGAINWRGVLGFVFLIVGGGCGRANGYEPNGLELVGTWGREASNNGCDELYTFEADGTFSYVMSCRARTQRVVGSYEVDGDVVKVWPASTCTPPYDRGHAALWHVDDYRLELDGGEYYRDEFELPPPLELCL